MTTEQQRVLNPADPFDAVIILDHVIHTVRMDGLTGTAVEQALASIRTLRSAVQELAAVTKDRNEKAAQLADLLNAQKPDHG